MTGPRWTPEEIAWLEEHWGTYPVDVIARRLGRSVDATRNRAYMLGLGPSLEAGSRVSLKALLRAIYWDDICGNAYSSRMRRWLAAGLPVARQRIFRRTVLTVGLDKFWTWAEQHQQLMDFSRFEEGALGAEPAWVRDKRRRDARGAANKGKVWSAEEDERLRAVLATRSYDIGAVARMFGRTEFAVASRVVNLGLPTPLRAARRPWTPEETEALLRLRAEGWPLAEIARRLGRTENSCIGKCKYLRSREARA